MLKKPRTDLSTRARYVSAAPVALAPNIPVDRPCRHWPSRIAFVLLLATFFGCGGSGGPKPLPATLVGRVLNVETGGPTNPQSSVQSGSGSVLTSSSDGSFQLSVSAGVATAKVDTHSASGVWNFAFPPASGVTDIGDLWIGPEKVMVRGLIRDSTTSSPVSGATIGFAGRWAASDAAGVFNLAEVAYSSTTQTAFWGIVGTIRAVGYFTTEFSTQPFTATGGVVDVGDIFITPVSDPSPPGPPYNIWGVISVSGGPQGTIVRLKQGGVDVRVFNVGADGRYFFFVTPGTYTISAAKGALTAPDQDVTLSQANEVIRRDFQLQ